jgi:hypothetical protein
MIFVDGKKAMTLTRYGFRHYSILFEQKKDGEFAIFGFNRSYSPT